MSLSGHFEITSMFFCVGDIQSINTLTKTKQTENRASCQESLTGKCRGGETQAKKLEAAGVRPSTEHKAQVSKCCLPPFV